jgi:DNA polymerase elongation subunit (family B)
LKNVARHLGIASEDREHVPGARVHEVYLGDRERVRRYARGDVEEVAGVARMLGGAAFALAKMAPRRYERLADAGPATGVIDPLLVRAYLRAGQALPLHRPGDGTEHQGAGLHLFAAGVAQRIVKADVASLYPSLMRQYSIGPSSDRLGALLAIVDRLTDQRLAAKAAAKALPAGSSERHASEAVAAAMKIVINSAYGYLGAVGLTRFSDVHAANEITRRGREVLDLLCRELAARGGTLLEADTDGVYFAVPATWTADDEARVVHEVAALLPSKVKLELDGRYAAMLSHEPKNYALLGYDGSLVLRGVAFRSSRAEPFGEQFLRQAIGRLLVGDVAGVRAAFVDTVVALRRRAIATGDVAARVRLTKTPADYAAVRESRRELAYEALLAAGRTTWTVGEHVRVYRARAGRAGLAKDDAASRGSAAARSTATGDAQSIDPRDYDVDHYVRVLRDTFASRLARAFQPADYSQLVDDPEQPSLFAPNYAAMTTVLTPISIDETDREEDPSSV